MEQKRCFISIPIVDTEDFSKILQDLKHQTNVVYSIVQPNNYHFTLHFFGPRNTEEIMEIQTILSEISFESFFINLFDFGILPTNPNKARVVIVKPKMGYEKLKQLGLHIRVKLLENGHEVDKRRFSPHLTVGRIRSKWNPQEFVKTWLSYQPDCENRHQITQFVLMESIPSSQGSIYKEIKSFPSVNQI